MNRKVTLYCTRKDAQYYDVPVASIGETVQNVAKLVRGDKPFAVDVLVDGKNMKPSEDNRQLVPPPEASVVIVQNCLGDTLYLPNRAWKF